MTPRVLNHRHYTRAQIHEMIASGRAVNCDRRSKYGNPYVMKSEADRDFVCEQFEKNKLPDLDVSELRDKDLLCWCNPLRCHCDAILKKANT
jgi:hypothetical protein